MNDMVKSMVSDTGTLLIASVFHNLLFSSVMNFDGVLIVYADPKSVQY